MKTRVTTLGVGETRPPGVLQKARCSQSAHYIPDLRWPPCMSCCYNTAQDSGTPEIPVQHSSSIVPYIQRVVIIPRKYGGNTCDPTSFGYRPLGCKSKYSPLLSSSLVRVPFTHLP